MTTTSLPTCSLRKMSAPSGTPRHNQFFFSVRQLPQRCSGRWPFFQEQQQRRRKRTLHAVPPEGEPAPKRSQPSEPLSQPQIAEPMVFVFVFRDLPFVQKLLDHVNSSSTRLLQSRGVCNIAQDLATREPPPTGTRKQLPGIVSLKTSGC